MKLKLFILVVLYTVALQAQNIDHLVLVTSAGTRYVPVYERQNTIYVSVKPLASALGINYYYNPETDKIELKFSNYSLKITAKNPYLILTRKGKNDQHVIQLPTSTYLIGGQLYVPLTYTLETLKRALGKDLMFVQPDRLIVKDITNTGRDVEDKAADINSSVKAGFAITGISIDEKANGTLVRVKSRKVIPSYYSSYSKGILTIIFRRVNADVKSIEGTHPEGLVKKIEVKNLKEDTEIQFKLGREYTTSEVINAPGSNDILITIHNKIFARNKEREKNKAKWDFDVIVIDAGHGGKDMGAIGINGVREKDVNLGIALKLGRLIKKKMKDVKVVFTRSTDKFVELYKRGKIANEKNGNLFISLHCNSTPKKTSDAHGFEVYLLRPGRTKEAIAIAERENSVIQYEDNPARYQKLTDENFILVSMAHSAYMKYSEKFSDILNKEFSKDLKLSSRGIKQAGFYVLVGAAMPSVLIESGFLSNKKDAKYLQSKSGQNKIAESIFKAIKSFKAQYEKSMELE